MNYIDANKAAWEEAFDHRKPNWGDDNHLRIRSGKYAFFDGDLKKELENIDFHGKAVAQFCCNNGRELLSLVHDSGAEYGIGFDIAENILEQAKQTAAKAEIKNCEFVNCNILEIPEKYHNKFDFIFFTIGAINWFHDLTLLFEKVGKCLKSSGTLLINDGHPTAMMLPFPGEDGFDADNLNRFTNSYFMKEAAIGNSGMDYISGVYESKTFTDFIHTLSDIINALSANGMKTVKFNEYDYDVGNVGSDIYDGKGIPMSYILIADKSSS
ncbi:MAG: class I SAM-dependent methyltransferase [Oscillospiraceae bacterium]|nr:class I SAM-dependent methyltransferase [Oscillospiraceae bacterium]